MKRAVVTGITGQDAAYLSELLLNKGYLVYGTYRSSSGRDFWRVRELGVSNHENLRLVEFQATDLVACQRLLEMTDADEFYNLGGQSSAVTSRIEPLETAQANGMAVMYLLEAIRLSKPSIRFFQAGSSELFGQAEEVPQVESTSFKPTSPYGVSKLFAHWATVNYRDVYGLFGTSGIFFNHESPLRGIEFVTRKITDSFARIKLGKLSSMDLGNMDSKRDWGYAKDYVLGMWRALQADESDTFVFGTNQAHTVREFATLAGNAAGFDLVWEGCAENEVGIDRESGLALVRVNPKYYRPLEIDQRIGNPAKAFDKLHWRPTTTLDQLCRMMVDADIRRNGSDMH